MDVEPTLRQLLTELWRCLSRRRQLQLGALIFVMLLSSAAEVMSLASVLPFLAVLAGPKQLWEQPLVRQLSPRFGIASADELLLPITILFVLAALLAGAIRVLNLWLNGRLAAAIGSDLSCEAYKRTLYQPYAVHLSNSTNELIALINSDVPRTIFQFLNPLLLLINSSLIALGLAVVLLVIDWSAAVFSGLVIVIFYGLLTTVNRKPLQRLGQDSVIFSASLIRILQEGLGGIRDIILDRSQPYFFDVYSETDRALRRSTIDAGFLSAYPRLILESLGMSLIALVGYFLVRHQGVESVLPLLGALGLGAQRLLPVVQKIYEGWAQASNAQNSLLHVLRLVAQPIALRSNDKFPPLKFCQGINFQEVAFSYGPNLPVVLSAINFEICSGERIGIIGSTGSGKSTIVDLLMGLTSPTSGRILVDGVDLHDSDCHDYLLAWRNEIAHVPQHIYLSDSSIAENIAFGISKHLIDHARLRQAASDAQIAGFIESSPNGYDTPVGERGIRLSGGQRQRIGIARALYKQSSILVFDEATSALDAETESSVIDAIDRLSKKLTIVMIAHRLSTLSRCDRVIEVANGTVTRISQAAFL